MLLIWKGELSRWIVVEGNIFFLAMTFRCWMDAECFSIPYLNDNYCVVIVLRYSKGATSTIFQSSLPGCLSVQSTLSAVFPQRPLGGPTANLKTCCCSTDPLVSRDIPFLNMVLVEEVDVCVTSSTGFTAQ